LLYNHFFSAF